MVIIKASIVLAVLFSLSSGKAFTPFHDWIMTSRWINAINSYEIDDSLGSTRKLATSDSSSLVTTCGQTKVSPDIMGDFSGSSTTEIAVSAWLYQITREADSYPFSFYRDASNAGHDYSVQSGSGIFIAFFDDQSVRNSFNDMVIYDALGEWMFFTFYWVDVSGTITWKIYSQNDNKEATGTNPAYVWPNLLDVGYKMNGYFYEIIVHSGASSVSRYGTYVITLLDDQGGSYVPIAGGTGSPPCTQRSHPKYGCLPITSACLCPAFCSNCDSAGVCQGCTQTHRTLSTECQCFENCVSCDSNYICNHCDANYFRKIDNDYNIRCFCKIYVACTTSCQDCDGGECYLCADLIVQDSGSCREESVGFQISFSYPNIIVDFAVPLQNVLTIDNLTAKDKNSNTIDASNWQIDPSSTLSRAVIETDNINESSLPFYVNLSFNS